MQRQSINIPISLISIFTIMVVQTFTIGWWASSMSAKIEVLQSQMTVLSKSDAINTKSGYSLEDVIKRLDRIDISNDSKVRGR